MRYAESRVLRKPLRCFVECIPQVALTLVVASTSPAGWADTQAAPQPFKLVENQPAGRQQAGGEEIRYEFEARPGRTYLLEVAQDGLDLVVSIEAPDGARRDYGSPLLRDESEFVMLRNTPGGLYSIIVFANEPPDSKGAHRILVTDSSASVSQEDAWQVLNDAAESNARGDRDSQLAALRKYEEAAQMLQGAANAREQAYALFAAAMLNYWVAGKWYRADELAGSAAQLYAMAGMSDLQADAILLRAMTLTEAINEAARKDPILEQVSALLDESYAIHERLGSVAKLAKIRYFNALSHLNAGHYEEAKEYYSEAAGLFRELGDWNGERGVLLDRAVIEIDTGNSVTAVETLKKLHQSQLRRNPNSGETDRNFIATVLDQLGTAHKNAGNIDDALEAYTSAQEMHHAVGDLHGEAESLRGIAGLYRELGDLDNARTFLQRARQVAEMSNNGRVLGVINATLGNIEYTAGNFVAAKSSYEAALALTADTGPGRAHREVLLARTLVALGEFQEARTLSMQALADAEESGSPRIAADALRQSAMALDGLGRPEDSIAALEQARQYYQSLAMTDGLAAVDQALAQQLARVAIADPNPERRNKQLDDALQRSAQSLDYIDKLLGKVSVPELRARYGASYRDYYQSHIELLLQRNGTDARPDSQYVAEALSTSERARARMMMDLLNEASVDLQRDINPDIATEMDVLITKLSASAERREQILARGANDDQARRELATLSEEIALIENQLAFEQLELRRENIHYGALTAPHHDGVDELQRLIDADSVLLQYYLAEDRSFVWVVTRNAVDLREIANRKTINAATERLIASLGAPNLNADSGNEKTEALREISGLVLQPVADLITARRVIVVADGMLHYLPFQTLFLTENNNTRSLLETHEVVALPSMSVLAALRGRRDKEIRGGSVAIFADPVFNASDPRLAPVAARLPMASARRSSESARISRSSLSGDLPRLQGTQTEAKAIAALVADDSAFVAIGFDASRNAVLEKDLRDFQIIHFATHGLVDRRSPALSALVLSRFDARGEPQDGYLRLNDIYRLDLNADLVVLSACETGLGTDIHGEGLVGLTQGFLYAGARSLLISLWAVPDRATAELMTRFYAGMMLENKRPAEALRDTQLSMASERRWSDPYYWGAFVLLGDW